MIQTLLRCIFGHDWACMAFGLGLHDEMMSIMINGYHILPTRSETQLALHS